MPSSFSPRHTPEGDALFEFLSELNLTFFKMRAAGKQVDTASGWGSGTWALLRSLQIDGPQTVPALARQRRVARQRVQAVVDDLIAEGHLELIENPRHKRSKLVQLTGPGHNHIRAMTEQIKDMADILGVGLDMDAMKDGASLLQTLQKRLEHVLDQQPQ